MKLPRWLLIRLQNWAIDRTAGKEDEIIRPEYLFRYHVFRHGKLLPKIYLHLFEGDDDDRALHDHPGPSISFMLEGTMLEHMDKDKVRIVRKGDIIFRSAKHRHRLTMVSSKAITLFIMWPSYRQWGFWPDGKFVSWQDFVDPRSKSND
jgi:mannose-6-phosphate isomerase-like protein (cupin superfamily)